MKEKIKEEASPLPYIWPVAVLFVFACYLGSIYAEVYYPEVATERLNTLVTMLAASAVWILSAKTRNNILVIAVATASLVPTAKYWIDLLMYRQTFDVFILASMVIMFIALCKAIACILSKSGVISQTQKA